MKPQAISWSRLSRFKNCPKQFHEITVLKRVEDTPSSDGDWGIRAHQTFQDYLKGKALPPEFESYRPYLEAIAARGGEMFVEVQKAIDLQLKPCDWFGPQVFVRAVTDVMHIQRERRRILVLDHKLGKKKPTDQLALTALVLFYTYPEIDRICTEYAWLKAGINEPAIYEREGIPRMWDLFLPDLQQYRDAFKTETWQPRQSGLCHGWCPVRDCEFWKPKRPSRR